MGIAGCGAGRLPLTVRLAADDTLSTAVCTTHTYFPLCFSWMFLIMRSPDALCGTHGRDTLLVREFGVPATPPSGEAEREDRQRDAGRGHTRGAGTGTGQPDGGQGRAAKCPAPRPAATASKTNAGGDHGLGARPQPEAALTSTPTAQHLTAPRAPPAAVSPKETRQHATPPPLVPGAEARWRSESPTPRGRFEDSGTVGMDPSVRRN